MLKNKLLRIALAGIILIGGTGMAMAGTFDADEVRPISAPIDEEVSTIFRETRFTDIQNHWAFDKIASMEANGFWEDLTNDFEPDKAITRDEFYKYLDKLFDFEDMPDFEFISEQDITRIQVAKAIQESFVVKRLSVITTLMFPMYDDTADLEENSALSFVFNTGIMIGRSAQKFHPHDSITRAEFAVVLSRTLAVLEIAEPIDEPFGDDTD